MEAVLEKPNVVWSPTEKQAKFLGCPAFEILYGGAKGGGKSAALLVAALEHTRKVGARVLIIRRQFKDLEGSIIQDSFKLYSGRGRYDSQHKRWIMPNKSTIQFGHCQTTKDMEGYYSHQYTMLGIDQVEQFPLEMYEFFVSLLRTTNPQIKCCVKITANPVGIGRGWLSKRFWILGKDAKPANKVYPVTDEITRPDGTKEKMTYYRAFVPSRVWDNPHIVNNDPQYILRLQQMSTEKRKALLDGQWDAFEGAFFTEFDHKVHVCEPFEIPPTWKRSISFDWGYSDPMACHWWAEDPSSGKIYGYREFFTNRMLDIDVARNIARMSYGENIDCIYYPWDLDFKNPQTGVSMRERMDKEWEGMGLRFYMKVGNKDRLNGWSAVRNLFSLRGDGEPHAKIFSSCKNLIENIPEQIHDEDNPEDLDTKSNTDHTLDSMRYFAATYRNFYEKEAMPMGLERGRLPVDVGAALKMPNGTYNLKSQPETSSVFQWLE